MLIAFSGIDGAGKSTQIELLLEYLRQEGRRPINVWTRRGSTPLFEGLKARLRRLRGRVVPPSGNNPQRAQVFSKGWIRRLWLTLASWDLLWRYGVQLRWWRWRGQPHEVHWYNGRPDLEAMRRRGQQPWLCKISCPSLRSSPCSAAPTPFSSTSAAYGLRLAIGS